MSGRARNVVELRAQTPLVLTKKQLAAHLGLSTRWVELRVADGMPVRPLTDRNGRRLFDLAAVESWLACGTPKPAGTDERLASLEAEVASLRSLVDELRARA